MKWPALVCLMIAALMQCAAPAYAMLDETGFAEANQVSLRYQLSGTGDRTIVLIHELGMSMESWDEVSGTLARNHRVLRYDLRGFGLSEKLRGTVRIEDQVEDLRALLDRLGITAPVTLVGSAVGGAIALRFAATHPVRVAAVMAISPAGEVAPPARAAYLDRAARLERLGMRADVDATLDSVYPADLRAGHENRVARFRAIQYANDPVSFAATLRMIAITEWTESLHAVTCPSWFVAVARYAARPVKSVEAMSSAVEKSRFEILDTGPFAPLQSPELLLPLIDKFLKATD
jgi:3-oxoadipate enol-lactonase